jgi:hypothetical protein
MDLSFIKKLNTSKKQVHFSKDQDSIPWKSTHHWMVILPAFFVIVAGLLALNMYILYKISQEEIFTVQADQTLNVPKINQTKLESVLDYFDKRAEKTDNALKEKPAVLDPSVQR